MADCVAGEFKNSSAPASCRKCASVSATYTDGTNMGAMSMEFCKTCTADNVCTECLTGFLWTSGANTACVKSCKNLNGADAYESTKAIKTCVTDCNADVAGTLPLARGDELFSYIHLKCVTDCWTPNKQYLS